MTNMHQHVPLLIGDKPPKPMMYTYTVSKTRAIQMVIHHGVLLHEDARQKISWA